MSSIPYESATVAHLAAGLERGEWTSRSLVETSLARIRRFDAGFGSVRCLAGDALEQAEASDEVRRRSGPRSPLEGVPIMVKDNIDMAGLPTTGGALALRSSVPAGDAHLIGRLREAGAVIVAKTNLSELAIFLTPDMPSGDSSLGGQVLNPYDTALTPSGSSSGSAAAVALGLVPVAVGTETDGSIISPADHQSLVGCKPTLGLVSRHGILPIAPSQDTAGPMARTVADAAALLAVLAGPDEHDAATSSSLDAAVALAGLVLDPGALAGVRLGVVTGQPDKAGRDACYREAVQALRRAGASLVEVSLPEVPGEDEGTVFHYEFAPAVDRYLAAVGPGGSVRSMAELAAWNSAHAGEALKFGQGHVERALAVDHAAERLAYEAARKRDVEATAGAMEAALAGGAGAVPGGGPLEALVLPGRDGYTLAARAGWPSVVIPAGYSAADRRPVGLVLIGRPWTDACLLALAHAAEQAHPARRPPWEINPAAFRRL